MSHEAGGSGGVHSLKDTALVRNSFGPKIRPAIDLNKATSDALVAHPFVGKRLAAKLLKLRNKGKLSTPTQLYHEGLIDRRLLRRLESCAFGSVMIRPMMQDITISGPRLYVGEAFSMQFAWVAPHGVKPLILSLSIRFPSGRTFTRNTRLSRKDQVSSSVKVSGFLSGESGELYVLATLRDEQGGVSQQSAIFGVFTRNPVQIFVTPDYLTQSGSAGAPKYDFSNNRWYCYAQIRWVNGEDRSINLGRRVDVEVTDAGVGVVATFSFNLSSDIVIPAFSTVYGNWNTSHGSGGVFDEFSAKGDLTFNYSMNGSGFRPARSQVWRTMRTIGYNIIRVGDFTGAERSEYQRAAEQIASGIFRSRDMTVYGVELYRIEGTPDMDNDKARYRFIDNQGEINDLRNKYTVNNWYLDVFFVEGRWDGAFGSSPSGGPVDKQGNSSGLVLRRDSDTVNLGQTFAHEGGHYLGLEHADANDGCADTDPSSPTISDNFIFSSSRRDSTVITSCQINKMRQHGLVRSMTP
jgi:Metallo-peptidase family M12B Reprolysin-like